jgi:flagellum-specific peptidoglycan hydrolase FlgJ
VHPIHFIADALATVATATLALSLVGLAAHPAPASMEMAAPLPQPAHWVTIERAEKGTDLAETELDLALHTASARWPDDHRRAFLTALAPAAVESGIEHCVLPSVVLGQAAQESGWGRSGLAKRHHNLFGVKAGSAAGVAMPTSEVLHGKNTAMQARFRAYGSWAESVEHHGRLLSTDPRYAGAHALWTDADAFLGAVAPTWASDPQYADKVHAIIARYGLDAWDRQVIERADCG